MDYLKNVKLFRPKKRRNKEKAAPSIIAEPLHAEPLHIDIALLNDGTISKFGEKVFYDKLTHKWTAVAPPAYLFEETIKSTWPLSRNHNPTHPFCHQMMSDERTITWRMEDLSLGSNPIFPNSTCVIIFGESYLVIEEMLSFAEKNSRYQVIGLILPTFLSQDKMLQALIENHSNQKITMFPREDMNKFSSEECERILTTLFVQFGPGNISIKNARSAIYSPST